MSALAVASPSSIRSIVHRSRGHTHGPITRLMSPGDLGQLLKPFVFLDLFDNGGEPLSGFGMHPHSGIATLTYIAEGSAGYEDTNGAEGVLEAGAVEWMQAGGGGLARRRWRKAGPDPRLPALDRLGAAPRARSVVEPLPERR
jgi:hypothetical protein